MGRLNKGTINSDKLIGDAKCRNQLIAMIGGGGSMDLSQMVANAVTEYLSSHSVGLTAAQVNTLIHNVTDALEARIATLESATPLTIADVNNFVMSTLNDYYTASQTDQKILAGVNSYATSAGDMFVYKSDYDNDKKNRAQTVFSVVNSIPDLKNYQDVGTGCKFVTGDLIICMSETPITVDAYPSDVTLNKGDVARVGVGTYPVVTKIGTLGSSAASSIVGMGVVGISNDMSASEFQDEHLPIGTVLVNTTTVNLTVPKYIGSGSTTPMILKPGELCMVDSYAGGVIPIGSQDGAPNNGITYVQKNGSWKQLTDQRVYNLSGSPSGTYLHDTYENGDLLIVTSDTCTVPGGADACVLGDIIQISNAANNPPTTTKLGNALTRQNSDWNATEGSSAEIINKPKFGSILNIPVKTAHRISNTLYSANSNYIEYTITERDLEYDCLLIQSGRPSTSGFAVRIDNALYLRMKMGFHIKPRNYDGTVAQYVTTVFYNGSTQNGGGVMNGNVTIAKLVSAGSSANILTMCKDDCIPIELQPIQELALSQFVDKFCKVVVSAWANNFDIVSVAGSSIEIGRSHYAMMYNQSDNIILQNVRTDLDSGFNMVMRPKEFVMLKSNNGVVSRMTATEMRSML